jgi:hypothetical protein
MPEEQAAACNARIERFNVYGKSISDQIKEKLDERDRIAEENERAIAVARSLTSAHSGASAGRAEYRQRQSFRRAGQTGRQLLQRRRI